MGLFKDAPDAPDYQGAAEAQGEASREVTRDQTYANRPNQTTPFGSSTWTPTVSTDPATGEKVTTWGQNVTLTPQLQQALNAQQAVQTGRSEIGAGMLDRIQQEFGPSIDWSKFQTGGSAVGGANGYRAHAGDALMSAFNARMDPKFERQTASLETTLRNRGFKPGDEGYNQALADLRQSQGDQNAQAAWQAQQLDAQEGQRLQGMDLTSSQYATQLRQQQIAEEQLRRNQSLNETNALLTGQQVQNPNMPSFTPAAQAQAAPYMQAAQNQGQHDLDVYNSQQQMFGNMMGAITSPFSFGFG